MNNSTTQNHNPKMGVLYQKAEYAGFFRRLIARLVDIFVLMLGAVILIILWLILDSQLTTSPLFFFTWFIIAYLYLAILKPTKMRTLGFILVGVKIVNLQGRCPSVWTMTLRFLLSGIVLLQPIYILIDLLWLSGDPNRQTLLDKAAGTYVVKQDATVVATGVQKSVIYHIFGLSLLFREVRLGRQPTPES